MNPRLKIFLLTALVVAVVDQVAKYLAVKYLAAGPVSLIPGFADLVLVYNRGAAFGSFAGLDSGPWLLIALNLVALGVMVFVLFSRYAAQRYFQFCLGLVAGGAIGNLTDRFRIGEVVDFMDIYVGSWHWPAFNVADSAITVGGVLMAWSLLRTPD